MLEEEEEKSLGSEKFQSINSDFDPFESKKSDNVPRKELSRCNDPRQDDWQEENTLKRHISAMKDEGKASWTLEEARRRNATQQQPAFAAAAPNLQDRLKFKD